MIADIAWLSGARLGPGTLYGAIARLERLGWIEPLAPEERRRPYRITAEGARALHEADHTAAFEHGGTRAAGGIGNTRLSQVLTRLYPRAWRRRYGAEFAVLRDGLESVRVRIGCGEWRHERPNNFARTPLCKAG